MGSCENNYNMVLRKQAAFSFAVLYIVMFCCSVFFGAVGFFRFDMLLIFNMVWPWFSCGTVCLSAVSLSRQWHDILDFSYCPLSRVLHVTLANWQGFGFEFHLGLSPSAFSGFVNISQPAAVHTSQLATPCWRDSIRSKQLSTVAIWLSVWTLSCHCHV